MLGEDVRRILDDQRRHKVLVVGDLMLDRYVWGEVERISPEAPVPVLRIQREEERLGGAASVAHSLECLGCEVELVGLIGGDIEGQRISVLLEQTGVCHGGVIVDASRPTVLKERQLARGQQVLRVDREPRGEPDEATLSLILNAAEARLADARALVLSDYGKGVLTDKVIARLMQVARKMGVKVLVDPKRPTFDVYRGAALITPNRNEAARAAGFEISDVESARRAAQSLMVRHDLGAIALTIDRDGIVACSRSMTEAVHLPTRPREVIDVTGAGDMVLSIFALALAGDHDLLAAAALANLAGGLVVTRIGVVTLSRGELVEAVGHQAGMHLRKLVSMKECQAIRASKKSLGQKLGLVTGTFDLIHPGHVEMIRQARAECDTLLLGLRTDTAARQRHGEPRPLLGFDQRARVLAALEDVDLIVAFNEDLPLDLLRALEPDVLSLTAMDEGEARMSQLVAGYGGRTVMVERDPAISTQALLAQVQARTVSAPGDPMSAGHPRNSHG